MSDVHGPELTAQPVGVIMPPREIRKIVDKTADFVARNGPSFEEVIMKDQMSNPKFSFLRKEDPYRAYFDQKVADLAKQLAAGTLDGMKTEETAAVSSAPQKEMDNGQQLAPLQISQAREFRGKEALKRELKAPPPDQYILNHPKIPSLDIEIIKLTAQFVARNGQKFLLELTEREKQNPAFDFLKPNHANFPYFTSLADSYAKIIMLKQEELIKLQTNIKEKMSILGRCGDRFEYEKMKQQESKKKEELAEEERLAMAQIDWDNFIIVETINRFEDELLPAASNLGAKEEAKAVEAPVSEESKRMQEKRPQAAPITLKKPDAVEPQPQYDVEAGVKIKSNYVRKSAAESNMDKCPLCKRMFPTSEINEHLRIEMLDPRYKDIKKEMEARGNAGRLDTSGEFFSNLKNFAMKRPDLFGSVEEEFRAEEQGKPKPVAQPVWDGSSMGLTRTTANVAMLAVQQKRNLEESQKVQDKMSGVIPAIVPTFPMPAGVMNPMFAASIAGAMGQSTIPQPTSNVGPAMAPMMNPMEPSRRAPTEASAAGLIPEDEWLEHHPGSITLRIRPQEHDESWQLKPGEAIEVNIDSRYTIGSLKEMLSDSFGGLPASKLKLRSGPHTAMKDTLTLAYYNLEDNAVIEVSKVRRRQ